MKNKLVAVLMLLMFLASMLTVAFNITPVNT